MFTNRQTLNFNLKHRKYKKLNIETFMITTRLSLDYRRGWIFDRGYTFEPRFPISSKCEINSKML